MILITGSQGQLGQELCRLLDEQRVPYVVTNSTSLDITDKEGTFEYIKEVQPTVIFHCAAYTAVDKAEDEGKEMNYLINVTGTENVVEAAKLVGATLVYISTDYVFDGALRDDEYSVDATTNPLNEYGKAKLLGEEAVARTLDNYFIIRTSWVFGEFGNNFVFTMKRLAESHDTLTVVNDQFGRPTWTRSLAEFMLYCISNNIEYGTYHFSNDNKCTWFDFASEILKDEPVAVTPVDSSAFPQKPKRPTYSVMSLDKVKATGFSVVTWQEALSEMLKNI